MPAFVAGILFFLYEHKWTNAEAAALHIYTSGEASMACFYRVHFSGCLSEFAAAVLDYLPFKGALRARFGTDRYPASQYFSRESFKPFGVGR